MTYASKCKDPECNYQWEWNSSRMTDANPECIYCGGPSERLYFPIAAVWTKNIAAYGDPRSEGFHKQNRDGGHWTLETDDKGKVSKTFIATPQDQANYCKRNHLVNPKDLPSNLSVAKDGKSYETVNRSEI